MPRRRRDSTAGLIFHVLNRAAKRAASFEQEDDFTAFEQLLKAAVHRHPVDVFAYCLMPNHWHLLLSPRTDGALSTFMHWLTTTHARRWQTIRGLAGHGAVYQGRFKAIAVSNDRHFLWVCRYVERNALRAALVGRAEDWRWSSLYRYERSTTWLCRWPVERPADWLVQVNEPQTCAEVEAFRNAVRKGEPYGNPEWRAATLARLGMKSLGKRGRRRKPLGATVLNK